MQTIQSSFRHLHSIISPLFPFYLLGQMPGQVLWPIIFVPLILIGNFIWALVLATLTIVILGQTERVGQHALVRYAAWATLAGVMIDIAHDMTLVWLSTHVDFLLEPQPWRLIAGTYLVPFVLLFMYHWLLSLAYLLLRAWQAVIMALIFALLTAPWTTLMVLDVGQGRLPMVEQKWLWLGLLVASSAVWLLAGGFARLRYVRGARRFGVGVMLAALAVVIATGGAAAWMNATTTSAIGSLGASGEMGDLAFTNRGRVYAVRSAGMQVLPLGQLRGQIVSWSPNGRFLLFNEQRSDNKTYVGVISVDQTGTSRIIGAGVAGPSAWSPDSTTIIYTVPSDSSGQIRAVRFDGTGDRLLAEGRTPSWSPDGRRIVYSARTAGRWQVWVILPTGGDAIQLTSDGGEEPIWSPDGRYIAYIQNNRVQVMDADGQNKRRLSADNTFMDVRPLLFWSSDGSRLAYIYVYPLESGRPTQIYTWEATTPALSLGSALLPLTTPTLSSLPGRGLSRSGDYRPPFAWSPDAVWLGFTRRSDIWALDIRTGEERRLSPGDSFAWGGRPSGLVIRPVPAYPATPTPTPLPPTVVESPSVLVLDPRDPTLLLAGTATGVIAKSGAGGWLLSSNGINYPTRVRTLAFDPADSKVLYAGTDGQRAVAGALYKSVDGGARWSPTMLKDVDIYRIVVDARQPTTIYVGTSKGIYASSDGGDSWSERNSGLKTSTVTALAVDPSQGRAVVGRATPTASTVTLYLGTRQGEIYKSTNGGSEWKLVQTINAPVTSLLVYPRKTTTVFATSEDGLFSSSDSGETWNQVSGGIWKIRLDGLVPHPKDDTIWAYGVQGVFVSHDGGTNWGPAAMGLEGTQPSALVVNPAEPTILYVGTDKGVFQTKNGGVTWSR